MIHGIKKVHNIIDYIEEGPKQSQYIGYVEGFDGRTTELFWQEK